MTYRSLMKPTICQILRAPPLDRQVLIQGWIRTVRRQKTRAFLEINDGSTLAGIQAVVELDGDTPLTDRLESLHTGCSVALTGVLKLSPAREQPLELKVREIELLGPCDPTAYPLQKKHHSLEFLRTIGHLRPRTNTHSALARVRNELAMAVHRYFQENAFLYVPTPIITTSDCEGGGDLFRISSAKSSTQGENPKQEEFFGRPAYLTVSGQLNAESYACALSRVYTFGPTFRAENSNTARHLAEFWMIEPEMAFADLGLNVRIAEQFIQYVVRAVLTRCEGDLAFFDERVAPGLSHRLESWSTRPFARISYTEAIEILQAAKIPFAYPCAWGADLQSEHERYLAEAHFCSPVIVTDYPRSLKPFYARANGDDKTVAAMDLLMPQVGEVIGGAQREERADVLAERLAEAGLRAEDYWWYLELRQFGTVPHSGFGAGFERLLRLVTGLDNVRDIAPFPRTPGNAEF